MISILFSLMVGGTLPIADAAPGPHQTDVLELPPCQNDIVPSDSYLPRELKLKPEVIAYATTVPKHARVIQSLARVFAVLTPAKMNAMRHVLRTEPRSDVKLPRELVDHEVFSEWPQLATPSARANLKILYAEYVRTDLTSFDLGVAAVLFGALDHDVARAIESRDRSADTQAEVKARVRRAMTDAHYGQTLARLLKFPPLAQFILNRWNASTAARDKKRPMVLGDLEQLSANAIARGARDPELLFGLHYEIMDSALAWVGNWIDLHDRNLFDRAFGREGRFLFRGDFLTVVEMAFSRTKIPDVALADIVDLMDYTYFGSSLPNDPNGMYQMTIEPAKLLVLPIKSAYQREATRRAAAVPPVVVAPRATSAAAERDFFAPQNVRKTSVQNHPLRTDVLPVPGVIYSFTFARNPERGVQSIKFGPDAVARLGDDVRRTDIINAVKEGMAWTKTHVGMRVMKLPKRRADGRVYSLQLGDVCGLLLRVNGTWQFVKIVPTAAADDEGTRLESLP